MKTIKKLLITLSIVCLTNLSLQAQKLIQPEEITVQSLSDIYDAALIDITVKDESYLKVKNMYEYFVDIDPKKRYITYSVSFSLNPDAKKEDVSELLNIINKDVALVKAYTNEDYSTITYFYYFWTDGGFTAKSLVGSLKLIDAALTLCVDKDTKGVL